MPLKGFLGPSSEAADLTRILRRRLAHSVYHAATEYSREYAKIFVYLQIVYIIFRAEKRLLAEKMVLKRK